MEHRAPAPPSEEKRRRGPKPNPDTRDSLLRAGARLLHGAGYGATGVKDIVDAASIPKGSFYNHFQSKEAFGAEVVDFYFESGLPGLREALTDPGVAPLDRLRTYFASRTQRFKDAGYLRGCMLGNFSLEVADQSDAIRERLSAHFQTWSRLFEHCIAQAQASGAIGNRLPAGVLAGYLLDSWEGALLRMRVEKCTEPLERFAQVTFQCLLT